MYKEKFNKLNNSLSQNLDGFSIKYKDESTFMKILGKLMFFCPNFMTGMTTTIGKTVYFTNKNYTENPSNYGPIITLAHEYRHAYDYDNNKFLFIFSYLFPQIISVLFLILFCISISLNWVAALVFGILFLCCLAPIPSWGRRNIELKGYTTNLFMYNYFHKKQFGDGNMDTRKDIMARLIENYNKNFIGSTYYFMWPFGIKEKLNNNLKTIFSEEILKDKFFENLQKYLDENDI